MKTRSIVFLFSILIFPNISFSYSLKEIGSFVLVSQLEKKDNNNSDRKSVDMTQDLNKNVQDKQFLTDKKRIYLKKIDFSGNFRGNVVEDSAHYLIEKSLQNLGFSTVQSVEEIRRETSERKEMRNNEEVKKSTLPRSQTIEREDVELFVTIYSIKSRKEFQMFALIDISLWGIYAVDIEKSKSTVGIVFKFVDNTTQTSELIIRSVGQTSSVDDMTLGGLGMYYRKRNDNGQQIELNAFVKALNNFENFFRGIGQREIKKKK